RRLPRLQRERTRMRERNDKAVKPLFSVAPYQRPRQKAVGPTSGEAGEVHLEVFRDPMRQIPVYIWVSALPALARKENCRTLRNIRTAGKLVLVPVVRANRMLSGSFPVLGQFL
ncbi:MAG: hypothetical protein AAB288_13885, partial [Acidobacteriota bacterium]